MQDDANLVQQAVTGDRDAAGEIYDRYAPLVRAILFDATGSLPEADDLAQEVFLKALSRLGQLRRADRLGAWIVKIARREGTEFRRQAARNRTRFTTLADDPPSVPPEVPGKLEAVDLVREAVRELPERERIAIHVHYLCEKPADVARQALSLSPSGFYKLLELARRRLHEKLLEREKSR